jgi:hypothetical protein
MGDATYRIFGVGVWCWRFDVAVIPMAKHHHVVLEHRENFNFCNRQMVPISEIGCRKNFSMFCENMFSFCLTICAMRDLTEFEEKFTPRRGI